MFPDVNLVARTRHSERETLYWTKAASILDMPQVNMLDSEVPIPKEKALLDLKQLLSDNLSETFIFPEDPRELIFSGWERLCNRFAPVFLEKSPHHLHQWSALELLYESTKCLPHIDFIFVGLIRNPMDTLYSQWRRWKAIPEKTQYQWERAYRNLEKFKTLIGNGLILVRYEDLVDGSDLLKKLSVLVDQEYRNADGYFHSRSLHKWKKDPFYGFRLSSRVMNLAVKFGYRQEDMLNDHKPMWPFYRNAVRGLYKILNPWFSTFRNVVRRVASS